MARSREIKPAFFKNEYLAECSPFARLLYIGLWTIADREGRMEYRPKRIKAELFPYDAVEINELAGELHGKKFIVLYESEGVQYLSVPGFKRHQRPHPKEACGDFPPPPQVVDAKRRYGKAVKLHGEPEINPASCAFPSSNPLILQSSNPTPPAAPEAAGSGGRVVAAPEEIPSTPKRKAARKQPTATLQDPPVPESLDTPAFRERWAAWLDFRANAKRKPVSIHAALEQFVDLARWGPEAACASIGKSIANDWQGLFEPDASKAASAKVSAPRKTMEEVMAEIPPDYFAHQEDYK